jgi:hypothetical protein
MTPLIFSASRRRMAGDLGLVYSTQPSGRTPYPVRVVADAMRPLWLDSGWCLADTDPSKLVVEAYVSSDADFFFD